MSDCKMNLTKNSIAAKGRNGNILFCRCDFWKVCGYVKTKALLEIMAEYFKVWGI
jgi:hypothetical protein